MPYRIDELLLAVAAPLLALILLIGWVALASRRAPVMNVQLSFLGLALTIRSCSVKEAHCLAFRQRATDIKEK